MRLTTIPLALGWLSACGAAPSAVPAEPPRPAASVAAPAALPRAQRCLATPGTVYGDEPVTFSVEGEGSGEVALEAVVRDRSGRVVARTTTRVPGRVQLPELPSGDFSLRVGADGVSCEVTVNRELSRATPGRN